MILTAPRVASVTTPFSYFWIYGKGWYNSEITSPQIVKFFIRKLLYFYNCLLLLLLVFSSINIWNEAKRRKFKLIITFWKQPTVFNLNMNIDHIPHEAVQGQGTTLTLTNICSYSFMPSGFRKMTQLWNSINKIFPRHSNLVNVIF